MSPSCHPPKPFSPSDSLLIGTVVTTSLSPKQDSHLPNASRPTEQVGVLGMIREKQHTNILLHLPLLLVPLWLNGRSPAVVGLTTKKKKRHLAEPREAFSLTIQFAQRSPEVPYKQCSHWTPDQAPDLEDMRACMHVLRPKLCTPDSHTPKSEIAQPTFWKFTRLASLLEASITVPPTLRPTLDRDFALYIAHL